MQTGICDRTQQVQDAIVALIPNVSNCADVTDTHLAAITGKLDLRGKSIDALAAGDFDGLTVLTTLQLFNNDLTTLPDDVFDDLTALTILELGSNSLVELPARVFKNNTALTILHLRINSLTALPDGLFSDLTSLTQFSLDGNSTDPMQLTVTVERVGTTDQVRAKVLAGAPFAVDIPVTVVDGRLAGGATTLGVAAGRVDGGPVTVTRPVGTTTAVTVDVDLSTQPTLPSGHAGYEFARASSGLPATILPVYTARPTVESVAVNSWPVRGGGRLRVRRHDRVHPDLQREGAGHGPAPAEAGLRPGRVQVRGPVSRAVGH